jgi:hypothetical protein
MLSATGGVLEIVPVSAAHQQPYRVPASERLVDLAAAGVRLEPGGIYLLSSDGRTLRIEISATATTGTVPPLARLVRF